MKDDNVQQTLNFLGRDSGFGRKNTSAYYANGDQLLLIDCGYTVFNELRQTLNLARFKKVDIIITHMHEDHVGSLGQFILYLYYIHGLNANVISRCKYITKHLEYVGVERWMYSMEEDWDIKFIETIHAPELDCYGFMINLGGRRILYTGDTATLEPYEEYLDSADELYVDASKNGGVHLQIDRALAKLSGIGAKGANVFLMHLDNAEYIKRLIKGWNIHIVSVKR